MDLMTFLFGDGSCVMAWAAIPASISLIGTGLSIANSQGAFGKTAEQEAAEDAAKAAGGGAGPGGVPSANVPSISAPDFRNNESAFWQQQFAGTGQGLPGGQLPPGIQENIDRQAALLPDKL